MRRGRPQGADGRGRHRARPACSGKDGPLAGKRLLVGSHIDTVVDAGRYDGMLGVVAGILAVEELRRRGGSRCRSAWKSLPSATRRACASRRRCSARRWLPARCATRCSTSPTPRASPSAPRWLPSAATPTRSRRRRTGARTSLGYLEVHIEQGPVLEQLGLPLGVVTSIAGAGAATGSPCKGEAGHAGTVPMAIRHDALAAAAEMILAVEAVGMIQAPAGRRRGVGAGRDRRRAQGSARREQRHSRRGALQPRPSRRDDAARVKAEPRSASASARSPRGAASLSISSGCTRRRSRPARRRWSSASPAAIEAVTGERSPPASCRGRAMTARRWAILRRSA